MKIRGRCPRGGLRSGWEHQFRKDVKEKEGRMLQEISEEKLWENRDR
jgi:hypothetical protein